MGADAKNTVYSIMQTIYKILKKKDLIADIFLERVIHFDASTKTRFDQLTEEDKVIWYMVLIMYKEIFEKVGNYYGFKEKAPEKFNFLNDKRPLYKTMNRVDLTRAYVFEQAEAELKQMDFKDLQAKTSVLVDPKELADIVRKGIIQKSKEL